MTNWPAYNQGLVDRGSITLWLSETVINAWHDVSGKGRIYHDLAIQCALSLRFVFRLALRQTQGLVGSLLQLLDVPLKAPNYSTLSRRAGQLEVVRSRRAQRQGPLHLVIDSTGLKLFGEGEWKCRVHGASKRRSWRKLHLAVDAANSEILAHCLTDRDQADNSQLEPLLDQIEGSIDKVSADGAYDSHACHNAIVARGAKPLIPPRRGASAKSEPHQKHPAPTRAQIVREIRKHGRKGWKAASGYHRRSLAETAMGRFKAILGPELKSRERTRQITEVDIKVEILNQFARIAMPVSVKRAWRPAQPD